MQDVEKIVKAIMNEHKVGFKQFEQSKGLTVNALCVECMKLIAEGKGERHIQISMDDEGNGFHTLFYGFTDNGKEDYDYHDDVDMKDIVLLG